MLKINEESFNGLDDSEKGMFTKTDEGYVLGQPEDVSGLKSALAKFKEKASTSEKQSKELQEALAAAKGGLSDTEHSALLDMIRGEKQSEAVKLLADGRTDEVIEILAGEKLRQLQAQNEALVTERDGLKSTNTNLNVGQAFSNIIGGDVKFLGNLEGNELVRNDLLQIFKGSVIETSDGLFIRDPSNPDQVLLDAKGEKTTPKTWYEAQREARPNFFAGTMASDHQGNGKTQEGNLDLSKVPTGGKIAAARAATSQ
jgi:hypothetical protein